MATLTLDTPRKYDAQEPRVLASHPVIASDIIYEGAAVGESGTSGNCRPLAGADQFRGFAFRKADNSSGAAAAIKVECVKKGRVLLSVTGVDGADDDGKPVFATDDNTFTLTKGAGTSTYIGHTSVHESGTNIWVDFDATREAAAAQADVGGSFDATAHAIVNAMKDALEENGLMLP